MQAHRFSLLFLLVLATPLAAQQDTTRLPTGVRLGMIYQTLKRPALAVRAFAGLADPAVAEQVGDIVRRDLDYSDRFEMFDVPPQLSSGPVDYAAWNGLNVVYVLDGAVEPLEDGYLLRLTLHDVVYGNVKQIQAFQLPPASDPDHRMAVHAAADEVVRWVTGQPGMAASRIVFFRQSAAGGRDLMVVDSDGENVRRLAHVDGTLMSPAWAPDGKRIVYTVGRPDGRWDVVERDLETGEERNLAARRGLHATPAYSPDGRRLMLAIENGAGLDIFALDLATGRTTLVRGGPGADLSPTFSTDGRLIAFNSDRIGQPHIYVMPADGGEATLLSPYTYGEPGHYAAPDWSPETSFVAFHGRSRGQHQIMVADASKPGSPVQQLTEEGRNEDPSWAPDGRHIVFLGVRPTGTGLYVIDAVSGRTRPLVLGGRFRMPDWSPTLMRASALTVRGE
ncbi:MAG TPA: hypothetical protein VF158_13035 [Longimicrobiales bacterium]